MCYAKPLSSKGRQDVNPALKELINLASGFQEVQVDGDLGRVVSPMVEEMGIYCHTRRELLLHLIF